MLEFISQRSAGSSLAIISNPKNIIKVETRIVFYKEKAGLISMFRAIKNYLNKEDRRTDFAAAIADQLIQKIHGRSTSLIRTLVAKPVPLNSKSMARLNLSRDYIKMYGVGKLDNIN